VSADPLAEVLRRYLMERYLTGILDQQDGIHEGIARAAREHIAAEIEADAHDGIFTSEQRIALAYAARIARGQT
jgi:hypothetical protein